MRGRTSRFSYSSARLPLFTPLSFFSLTLLFFLLTARHFRIATNLGSGDVTRRPQVVSVVERENNE